MSDPAAHPPHYASQPQPSQPQQPVYQQLLPSGPDRPTPVGLGLAGAGLLLLAVGTLIPQISLSGSDADEAGSFGLGTVGVELPGLTPALVLVVLAGWAAVGVKPGLQWAAKLGGIGLAAITVAAALHPVIELNRTFNTEGWEDLDLDVEASAGGGIWLYILAAGLLAASIFLMRWSPPKQPAQQPQYAAQPYQQQPPPQTMQVPVQPQQQPPPGNAWPGHNPQQ
ncbi:hypothetical protein [Glycomyces algeriensis]|uniref:Uncharacterized protein n=1 Tax=Glycomyces algeriensis TaxID=256037 RepID=A0A9W6G8E3_9ACTN|nr:hypothetical protein [Glycomyces algeriensis]MDA1365362.1 hypothetical protein [Glycomyces algeriensis]MDR7349574.1 hypothetical protein [Glycomyces algeriensis]GLI42280.1 hypothetical protein GALLR39Z86_21300 [Glycomyces algeriensis]